MENLNPKEYFDTLREKQHTITDEELKRLYLNCLEMHKKFEITGQTNSMKKLMFHMQCIEKEYDIIKMGINTFVYRSDIEYYIDYVTDGVVKVIELERFEREIPDEVVEVIASVKGIFDQLYIVFTDYTGEDSKKAVEERRKADKEKDPILFGTFLDKENGVVMDRFYYLADWVDEYCDLTLDKMISEFSNLGKRNISKTISIPHSMGELKAQLNTLEQSPYTDANEVEYVQARSVEEAKPSIFSRIRSFLQGRGLK